MKKSLEEEPYNVLFKGLTPCHVSQLSFNSDDCVGLGLAKPQLLPTSSGASNGCGRCKCRVRTHLMTMLLKICTAS